LASKFQTGLRMTTHPRTLILVTGGAGFIGSNLVSALHERGHPVAVCDRLGCDEKWRNLARVPLQELVAPEALPRFLEQRGSEVAYLFHMGAVTSTTERNADLVVETNFRLSQEIWRWCARSEVPLVYASSAATYGDGAQGFDDDGSPEGLAALRPLNPYGWSKHLFDRWVAGEVAEGRPRPPQWAGLKFFNVYGPNEYHKAEMRSLVTKAHPRAALGEAVALFRSHHPDYPDGGQLRDFVYVRDCVDVMLWLRERRDVSGLFNLGTGRAQSWLELMGALYRSVGRELRVEWVDMPPELRDRYQYYTEARVDRLRAAGYTAPFAPVAQGVQEYVERYLSTGDPYR
jgi:ADP-L-glycero-D-manno-heptose 6-epimerase